MKGGGGRIIEVRVGIELLPVVERERERGDRVTHSRDIK